MRMSVCMCVCVIAVRLSVCLSVYLSACIGLVPPVVASRLLGKPGEQMMLSMILMAVTSTGSSEVIAVTSILIYDVYGIYLRVRLLLALLAGIDIGEHGQGPSVHVRVRWIMETLKHPVCPVEKCDCVVAGFPQEKEPEIPLGEIPTGQYS